jgi:DNA-binding transcriptional LysR family regulator
MVGIGLGVGFVPLMAVREERDNGTLAVVEVNGFRLERSVWLVRRRAVQLPAAKVFMQTAVSLGQQMVGKAPAVLPKAERNGYAS